MTNTAIIDVSLHASKIKTFENKSKIQRLAGHLRESETTHIAKAQTYVYLDQAHFRTDYAWWHLVKTNFIAIGLCIFNHMCAGTSTVIKTQLSQPPFWICNVFRGMFSVGGSYPQNKNSQNKYLICDDTVLFRLANVKCIIHRECKSLYTVITASSGL